MGLRYANESLTYSLTQLGVDTVDLHCGNSLPQIPPGLTPSSYNYLVLLAALL